MTSHSVMTVAGDAAYRHRGRLDLRSADDGHGADDDGHRRQVRRRLQARAAAGRHDDCPTADDQHAAMQTERRRRPPDAANQRERRDHDHGPQLLRHLQELQDSRRRRRQVLFAAGARGRRHRQVSRLPVSIRIVLESRAAQLRRQEGDRGARARARQLGAQARAAPTRSRSSSRASCCRTSPACRCWPTSPRCATSRSDMGKNPKIIEPLVPVDLVVDHSVHDRLLRHARRARPQHEARILSATTSATSS